MNATGGWTFLSNYGHVLVALATDPNARMRDVAERVKITERAVQLIVRDLEQAGYVQRHRVGRRNSYTVASQMPLRHQLEQDTRIGDLLDVLRGEERRLPPEQSTAEAPLS